MRVMSEAHEEDEDLEAPAKALRAAQMIQKYLTGVLPKQI